LVVTLVPIAWLGTASLLVKCVLRLAVWNSPSGSYSFDHLSCFGVLYSLGFILVVVFGEWEGDDRI
jgi:hypothetical protein